MSGLEKAAGKVVDFVAWVIDHKEILTAVEEAIAGGATKAALVASIKLAMKQASDAEFASDLAGLAAREASGGQG